MGVVISRAPLRRSTKSGVMAPDFWKLPYGAHFSRHYTTTVRTRLPAILIGTRWPGKRTATDLQLTPSTSAHRNSLEAHNKRVPEGLQLNGKRILSFKKAQIKVLLSHLKSSLMARGH